jgi:cystathionine beta-lyase family protein involved in aluminum resistance
MGSLKDFGIEFEILDLLEDGTVDFDGLQKKLKQENYKAVC